MKEKRLDNSARQVSESAHGPHFMNGGATRFSRVEFYEYEETSDHN